MQTASGLGGKICPAERWREREGGREGGKEIGEGNGGRRRERDITQTYTSSLLSTYCACVHV